MSANLKKLSEQVIVITGASSGIGLTTARMAAEKGARLALAARSGGALAELVEELKAQGCDAIYIEADVSSEADVKRISRETMAYFGGFDTWVNNAGVSAYRKMLEMEMEDLRRTFETNFWGTVYGSFAAAKHLRGKGGAIINIGSTLSDRAIPIQGIYSASKHAVKGFTDALRMELEADGAPVSVTLIKPGAVATPYPEHAKNYLDKEPSLPLPIYAPEVVAEIILHCAEHPERDMFAGGGGKMISLLGNIAPRLTDKFMEWTSEQQQKKDSPPPLRSREDNGLYRASGELRERGNVEKHVSEMSIYNKITLNPYLSGAIAVGAGLAVGALLKYQANSRTNNEH